MSGPVDFSGFLAGEPVATAIEEGLEPPVRTALLGNGPNPFNRSTLIRFVLATEESVELSIYDITGQRILHRLAGVYLKSGLHEIAWNGTDETGLNVANGVYLYHLTTPAGRIGVGRMVLLR
jgi:hypothetical protein